MTSNTKAIIFAYPYGKWYNIEQLAKFCKSFDLKIIEDLSEGFSGVRNHGSVLADLSMFSFGMLKHFTAFGGSVSIVRTGEDDSLYRWMREIEKSYPTEPAFHYLTRVAKGMRLLVILNSTKNVLGSFIHSLQQYKILHYEWKPMWKLR